MNGLLAPEVVDRLVGVIDLRRGNAVHAIAGNRDLYQPVACVDGDPLQLVEHYRQLGLRSLYVADLDSLQDGSMQQKTLNALCEAALEFDVLLDVGLTGFRTPAERDGIARLAQRYPSVRWVAATETCHSPRSLVQLTQWLDSIRLLLGLDYRDGHLITGWDDNESSARDQGHDDGFWVDQAMKLGFAGVVILELKCIGKSAGPSTMEICSRVKGIAPALEIYSGGGVRSVDDLQRLTEAGCDACLVATALHS